MTNGQLMFRLLSGVAVIELLTPNKGKVVGCNLSLEVADVWSLWAKLEGDPVVAYALKDKSWKR
jgi:hypothetical protein